MISARLDGSLDEEHAKGLVEHVAGCRACRGWEEDGHRLRRFSLRPIEQGRPIPAGVPRSFLRQRVVRFTLAWVGLLLVIWNGVDMVEAGSQTSIHLSRHQGAVGVALGLTFFVVAWRPDRAYGLVPFAAIFTAALAITAVIDVLNGVSSVGRESRHFVELAGLALLWVLGLAAGPGFRRGRPRDRDSALANRRVSD